MATAQALIIQGLVDLINNNNNLNAEVIASSPSAGYLRVTAKGTGTPAIAYLAGGSSVTGAGTFATYPATGSPKYAELAVSWTVAPGDTVKINVNDGVRSVDLTYNLPLGTTVDAGGFDHTTAVGGGGGAAGGGGVIVGGSGIGSATHRRLVVVECGSGSASFGSMFALDPQDATGVAIPTFRVVTSLPTGGSSLGESIYVTSTRQGYVWDGTAWRDVTASPIRAFANDAALQADTTEAIGTYAVASDTGNMYVRTPDGWRRIGISEFATYADLLSYNAPAGSEARVSELGVDFLRVDDGGTLKWTPISQMVKTEAEILATQNIEGLFAIATDTASTFINDGTRWIEDPIAHYPTEVGLLADTATVGHIAWADDTSQVFVGVDPGTGPVWRRLQGPNVAVGATTPTGNAAGDLWLRPGAGVPAQNHLEVYDGAAWQSATPAQPIGTIIQSMLTEAQFNASLGPVEAAKWCLADGRNVAGSAYAQITSQNVVPDLRGAFIRGAGQNQNNQANWNGGAIGSWHNDTTRTPRTSAFTTSNPGGHTHSTSIQKTASSSGNIASGNIAFGDGYNRTISNWTNAAGAHTHTITGGGDAETAPVHFSLNIFIRVN